MVRLYILLAALVMWSGCHSFGSNTFSCTTSDQCTGNGKTGTCQADGLCSFEDPSCTSSGQRYGDLSGSLSGHCVGEQTTDGGVDTPGSTIDSPPDVLACYGTGLVSDCFNSAPSG